MIGRTLGGYQVVAKLGEGGMGEVYRARDTKLNRDVAVKVLPGHLATDPAARARFEREAQAVAALSHPNILAIFDFGEAPGVGPSSTPVFYAVTELLEGETLRAKLAGGALPVRKAVDYATQIVRGIAAAHEKGIAHRDLKPENIFVTKDGHVKVLDFGLAKALAPEGAGTAGETQMATGTTPGTVLGTVGYMSPEQVRGQPLDHRTDIFSFGTVLYEMLTGRRPFHGDSQVETMNAILKEDPPDFADVGTPVPGGLDRVVRRCLEKSPDERFHSAHDLALALEAVSGQSSQGTTAAVAAMTAAPAKRGVTLWLAAAAGLIVVAVAAFAGGRWTAAPPPTESPVYHRLTFRRGSINSARFGPDGKTVVYAATWEGGDGLQLFSTREETPESLPLPYSKARLASVSASGELALIRNQRTLQNFAHVGTLARASMSGGAARDVLEDVQDADWLPDGSGLVVAHFSGGRYHLEFPIGTSVYETAGYISDPRVSPDGTHVAFIDHPIFGDDRGSVALVDRAGTLQKLTPEYSTIQGLAWSHAGDEIWLTGADQGSARGLFAVTPAGRLRVASRGPGNLHLGDVSDDGSVLLWDENTRIGLAGRAPGTTEDRDLSWFDWGIVGDISADGRSVLFSEQGDGGGPEYSVYLRGTDGSPAVRLGEGNALALSPDGKWALSERLHPAPAQLVLLPTGAGQPRQITSDALTHLGGAFTADGTHVVFSGFEPGHKVRMYLQDLSGGAPKAITPEGITGELSPDGGLVASGQELYVVPDGPAKPVPGLSSGERFTGWGPDGHTLYVRGLANPAAAQDGVQIVRIDIATGRRTPVRIIRRMPGTTSIGTLRLTPDASAYFFAYPVAQGDLFQVTGMR